MSLITRLPAVQGDYRENANLGKMCWFQVGGAADVLFKPKDVSDLCNFLANKPDDVPYFVFGVGSNILIRDSGFRGVAIRLGREFTTISHSENIIKAGAGALDVNVALYSSTVGIAGVEFLSGIPGTIGGALAMNAGAYGTEIKDVLISAKAVTQKGELKEFNNQDFGFRYRGQSLDPSLIFVEASMQGSLASPEVVKKKIEEIQNRRESTQPIRSKTGGSTFQNPEGHKAWQLIDQAGCRGLKIGGAQVSEMHCNFFINTGDATASDLENLINEVKSRVLKTSGISLHEEIRFIG
jgi:UDP-N-acetylmuramate dehydrogenase